MTAWKHVSVCLVRPNEPLCPRFKQRLCTRKGTSRHSVPVVPCRVVKKLSILYRLTPEHSVWLYQATSAIYSLSRHRLLNGYWQGARGLSTSSTAQQVYIIWTLQKHETLYCTNEYRTLLLSMNDTLSVKRVGSHLHANCFHTSKWKALMDKVEVRDLGDFCRSNICNTRDTVGALKARFP